MVKITRETLNNEALKLSRMHKNLLLEFATGTGKTKVSLDLINHYRGNWLVVVAEKAHLKNWIDDIWKHGYESLLENITFVLYASLHKHIGKEYHGIVLDESHRCVSDKRRNALRQIKLNYSILLTATITKSEKFLLETAIGKIHTFKFNLSDAVENNILPKPVINLIPLTLDNTRIEHQIVINKGIKAKRNKATCSYKNRFNTLKLFNDVELTINCTELEKYQYLCDTIDYLKQTYLNSRQQGVYNRWMQTATVRKRFINSLKTPHVKTVISQLPKNDRFICFTGSIAQCNELGGQHIVHSKIKDPQAIIDSFNDMKINRLFVVDMLKEGVNLVEADGIIVQLDSKSRSAVQQVGRSLRKQSPVIYIFYYKDTIDEKYLKTALEELEDFVVKS